MTSSVIGVNCVIYECEFLPGLAYSFRIAGLPMGLILLAFCGVITG